MDWLTSPSVGYTYEDGSSGTIRRTGVVYPDGRAIAHQYAAGKDDAFNRVTAIADGPSASAPLLAQYARLGLEPVRSGRLPAAALRCDLAFGTGPDPYAGLDQFGRIIDLRWWNPSSGQDVDRIQHGYDLRAIVCGGRTRWRPRWASTWTSFIATTG